MCYSRKSLAFDVSAQLFFLCCNMLVHGSTFFCLLILPTTRGIVLDGQEQTSRMGVVDVDDRARPKMYTFLYGSLKHISPGSRE